MKILSAFVVLLILAGCSGDSKTPAREKSEPSTVGEGPVEHSMVISIVGASRHAEDFRGMEFTMTGDSISISKGKVLQNGTYQRSQDSIKITMNHMLSPLIYIVDSSRNQMRQVGSDLILYFE